MQAITLHVHAQTMRTPLLHGMKEERGERNGVGHTLLATELLYVVQLTFGKADLPQRSRRSYEVECAGAPGGGMGEEV